MVRLASFAVFAVLLLAASCFAAPGVRERLHYEGDHGHGGYGGGGGGGGGGGYGGRRPGHIFDYLPFGGHGGQSYSKSSASASSSSGSFGRR